MNIIEEMMSGGAGQHPCVVPDCDRVVEYDDEPWCFTHWPAGSGSSVPGYSYKREVGS